MGRIMRRLESDERWWAAEILFRIVGLMLLALCSCAALWLYRSVHLLPAHNIRVFEYGAALIAFVSWSLGWSFLVEGPGLFKLMPVPPRHQRFVPYQRIHQ